MPPSQEDRVKALKARREAFRIELGDLKNILDNPELCRNSREIGLRVEELHTEYTAFAKAQPDLDAADEDGQFLRDRMALKSLYTQLKARALDLLSVTNTSTAASQALNLESRSHQSTPSSHSEAVDSEIQLPKINLPTFSGNYEEWPGFADQFRTAVHDNTKIGDCKKLMYLRSCLKDEALKGIESLSSSAANYAVARALLEKRYNQPAVIVTNHLKSLCDLPITRSAMRELRSFTSSAEAHYRSLQSLKQPTVDTILIHLLLTKVDKDTSLKWREYTRDTMFPKLERFFEFLHDRCQMLEPHASPVTPSAANGQSRSQNPQRGTTRSNATQSLTTQVAISCSLCKGTHYAQQCETFTRLSVQDRGNLVKSKNLCYNCLRPNHSANQCRSTTCKRCHKKHHTLLHVDAVASPSAVESPTAVASPSANLQSLNTCLHSLFSSEIFLATALIEIIDNSGRAHTCRVLLDSCSHAHFLSYKFFNKLDLTHERASIPLSGSNDMSSTIKSQTRATIKSRHNNYSRSLQFLITNRVSQNVPTVPIDRKALQIPQNLPLADPHFHESTEADGLLGAQVFWDLLSVGCIRLVGDSTELRKTKLGWIVVGEFIRTTRRPTATCNVITTNLEQQISKFWELEERPVKKHLSGEERDCENHYTQHTRRDADSGRYSVRLPIKDNVRELGESYSIALKRFLSLEKQLNRNPQVKEQYTAFLKEYQELNHMSAVHSEPRDGFFLPHHAVTKADSLTTKIRVVFDASAKSSTGISLNDTLMVGPTIQDDLFTLVSRFRVHRYVLTADIAKMYRQIEVASDDRKFQKILWREHNNQPLQTFALNTVTYGVASAPFLAIRTLQQLARDEGHTYPVAAQALQNDFYVDDMLTGAATFKDAEVLRDQLVALTARGGLQLRQWASNDPRLLDPLHTSDDQHMTLSFTDQRKTLGLFWHPQSDTIGYTVKHPGPLPKITKRGILSRIAELFDPLGLLGPIIVKAKLIMQELWKLNIHWDESVPVALHSMWNELQTQLPLIEGFKVSRPIISSHAVSVQLHGFCDASEQAYGACLYLRSIDAYGTPAIKLVCSKSRVAPLKTQSLPRLELCAAVLLIQLYQSLSQALKITLQSSTFWTDSMIALHWIRTPPHSLKQFIANRVSEIQQLSQVDQWRHVPSLHNPADILSRGSTPSGLLDSQIWTTGPLWLEKDESNWPVTNLIPIAIPEQRSVTVLHSVATTPPHCEMLSKFSSLTTLIRVVAYCYRFITNSRKITKYAGQLSTEELNVAHTVIIRRAQFEGFQRELKLLSQNLVNHYTGCLSALKPFVDPAGLLRVGGRLGHASLTPDHKHPFVLPNKHPVTDLIIRHYHVSHGHAGAQATLNAIRQRYWPINGKVRIKALIHKCVICFRARPSLPVYEMGILPKHRVTYTRPFLATGVDYCGPFLIKEKKFRNTKRVKCYVAVFVCFATRAIHLELVSDLTTDAFIAALRRFFARRGKAQDMYSDNATNFVGANRELKEVYRIILSETHNEIIKHHLANDNVTWHFIPPRAPHFGGLWEAAVKSFKRHAIRLLGDTLLTYETFTTCLAEIEAILNSRPITPVSADPTDLIALTPSHFLIGDSLTSIPERDFTATKVGRLSNWQQTQQIRQHFWTRWHREYLNELTVRQKWHQHPKPDIKEGMLVVLKEDNLPPLTWPLGRITEIHPGEDGIVRVVTVKTAHGTYKRATKKIAPIPLEESESI